MAVARRNQHRIVEHEKLCVEERCELPAALLRHARPDVGQLLAGAEPTLFQPVQLVVHARRSDLVSKNLGSLNQNHRSPGNDARRHPNTGQTPHVMSSPKPDATRSVNASNGAVFVGTIGGNRDCRPISCGQQKNPHDALPVHLTRITSDSDLRLEPSGEMNEFRRGARVHAQPIDDRDAARSHGALFSPRIKSEATQMALRP